MKFSAEHFETLRANVSAWDTEDNRKAYRNLMFPRADRVKDLNVRYRWDLYWVARRTNRDAFHGIDDSEYTSDHIDTALRKIVPVL